MLSHPVSMCTGMSYSGTNYSPAHVLQAPVERNMVVPMSRMSRLRIPTEMQEKPHHLLSSGESQINAWMIERIGRNRPGRCTIWQTQIKQRIVLLVGTFPRHLLCIYYSSIAQL